MYQRNNMLLYLNIFSFIQLLVCLFDLQLLYRLFFGPLRRLWLQRLAGQQKESSLWKEIGGVYGKKSWYFITEVLAVQIMSTSRNSKNPSPINTISIIENAWNYLHSTIPNAIKAIAQIPKKIFNNLIIKNRVGLPALRAYLAIILVRLLIY